MAGNDEKQVGRILDDYQIIIVIGAPNPFVRTLLAPRKASPQLSHEPVFEAI